MVLACLKLYEFLIYGQDLYVRIHLLQSQSGSQLERLPVPFGHAHCFTQFDYGLVNSHIPNHRGDELKFKLETGENS